jgi:hypothetical protein
VQPIVACDPARALLCSPAPTSCGRAGVDGARPARDPASAEERRHDKAVLESLLVRASDGQRAISEDELHEAFGAKETQQKLTITDALSRLDAAGLIERRGGRAIASEVAAYFDHIMIL